MKVKIITISVVFALVSMISFGQKNSVEEANNVISKFKEKDAGISKFFDSAYGYAVFPSIGKGGFVVGGAGGKGTVYKGGSAVADVKMSQVTVGAQVGGQKYSEVIFFKNAAAYDEFVKGTFEMAAQISAVALADGVSTDAAYQDGILVFTMSIGGLMAEVSAGGQKFNVEFY